MTAEEKLRYKSCILKLDFFPASAILLKKYFRRDNLFQIIHSELS